MSVYKTYLCEYQHDGASWVVEVPALSFKDAERRLHKMPFGKVLGEKVLAIPAAAGGGLLVRLACWLRNLIKGTP